MFFKAPMWLRKKFSDKPRERFSLNCRNSSLNVPNWSIVSQVFQIFLSPSKSCSWAVECCSGDPAKKLCESPWRNSLSLTFVWKKNRKMPTWSRRIHFYNFRQNNSQTMSKTFLLSFRKRSKHEVFFRFLFPTKRSPSHIEFIFDSPADVFAQFQKNSVQSLNLTWKSLMCYKKNNWKVSLELQMGNLTTMLLFFLPILKKFCSETKNDKN